MSFGINAVTISGNLVADPELRSTPSGMDVLNLSIAYNGRKKNQAGEWEDQAHFFDAVFFGGTAKWLANNISKGTNVVIKGRLEQRRWQDKETGANRYAVSIIGDDIVVPRGSSGGGGGDYGGGSSQSAPPQGGSAPPAQNQPPPANTPPPASTPNDDIPFHNDGFPSFEKIREHCSRW